MALLQHIIGNCYIRGGVVVVVVHYCGEPFLWIMLGQPVLTPQGANLEGLIWWGIVTVYT